MTSLAPGRHTYVPLTVQPASADLRPYTEVYTLVTIYPDGSQAVKHQLRQTLPQSQESLTHHFCTATLSPEVADMLARVLPATTFTVWQRRPARAA